MKNMLSLEAFADWASKQPAEKEYSYVAPWNCAFCQFLKAIGFENPIVAGCGFAVGAKRTIRKLPAGVDKAVAARPRDFGALATRLRKASAP